MNISVVTVQGRLVDDDGPLQGQIWFVPTKPAFEYAEHWFAVKGGHCCLEDGTFSIELTPTDTFKGEPFMYDVYCGNIHWRLKIEGEGDIQLADLIPRKADS